MKNYKLEIQYDGTKYNGWQKQGNTKNTIQEKFENVLKEMVGKKIEIFASGRTDAGVHAKCQVANFKCETSLSEKEILNYLNHYLPKDIKVLSVEIKDDRFHSRLNVKQKTYKYVICNNDKCDVFQRKYQTEIKAPLDIEEMTKASRLLLGEHDFKAFCSNKNMKKSTVREIYSIEITKEQDIITIRFTANGFLYNMVRIMVGTLIEVGLGKIKSNDITNILNSKKRDEAGYTAPPQGLFLERVIY